MIMIRFEPGYRATSKQAVAMVAWVSSNIPDTDYKLIYTLPLRMYLFRASFTYKADATAFRLRFEL
jgi:hypothetical protein